jgi:hypothetical protein
MSNFYCEICNTAILEGSNGKYITGCPHHPLVESSNKVLSKRKKDLIEFLETETGLKLRGIDVKIAKMQISNIWKLGFTDEMIIEAIYIWTHNETINKAYLTWPYIYRNIERLELKYKDKVISERVVHGTNRS